MKKFFFSVALMLLVVVSVFGQNVSALDRLKDDPRRAFATDYPYKQTDDVKLTKAPKGYKPFYISHYARHGSRYYWSTSLYMELDTLLTVAHQKQLLTAAGEEFRLKFMTAKDELMTGVEELTEGCITTSQRCLIKVEMYWLYHRWLAVVLSAWQHSARNWCSATQSWRYANSHRDLHLMVWCPQIVAIPLSITIQKT